MQETIENGFINDNDYTSFIEVEPPTPLSDSQDILIVTATEGGDRSRAGHYFLVKGEKYYFKKNVHGNYAYMYEIDNEDVEVAYEECKGLERAFVRLHRDNSHKYYPVASKPTSNPDTLILICVRFGDDICENFVTDQVEVEIPRRDWANRNVRRVYVVEKDKSGSWKLRRMQWIEAEPRYSFYKPAL